MTCRAHLGGFVAALLCRKSHRENRFPISHTKRLSQQPVNVVQNHGKLAGVDTLQFSLPRTAASVHVIEFTRFGAYMGQCNSRTQQTLVLFTYIRVRRLIKSQQEELRRSKTKVFSAFQSNSRKAINQAPRCRNRLGALCEKLSSHRERWNYPFRNAAISIEAWD